MGHAAAPESSKHIVILSLTLGYSGIPESRPTIKKYASKKKKGKFKTADYRRKLNSPDKFSARN